MEASMRLVEEILPGYGFSQSNVELTKSGIKNSYTDNQESLADNIMHDAKYDYLGRVDYMKLTDRLLRERTEYGKHPDNKTWIEFQKKLLTDHQFITTTAKLLRNVPVEEQIAVLQVNSE
jgi:uncharacterized protein